MGVAVCENERYSAIDEDHFWKNQAINTRTTTSDCQTNGTENGNCQRISKNQAIQPKVYVGWKRFLGLGLSLLASVSMTSGNLFTKMMTNSRYHVVFITFTRYQGMTLFGAVFLGYVTVCKRGDYFEPLWPLTTREKRWNVVQVVLRATLGTVGIGFFYLSMTYLPLADAAVILYSNPILTVFLARIFLKEPLGVVPILMTVLAIAGIFIIARPPFLTGQEAMDSNKLIGVAMALIAVTAISCVMILMRSMRKLNIAVFMTCYGFISTVYLLLFTFVFGYSTVFGSHEFSWRDFGIMMAVAVLNMLGQTILTLAMKFENAGTVSLYRTIDIIFNFTLQFLVLGVVPQSTSLIGASIICVATFTIGFRAWLTKLPLEHGTRKRFVYLLK